MAESSASRLSVALFTDSVFHRDVDGRSYPVRDEFVRFIARLGPKVGALVVASRCKRDVPVVTSDEAYDSDAEVWPDFQPLPFYENTEDFLRRGRQIREATAPAIRALIDRSDVVVLRIHHSLAPFIANEARRAGTPLVAYWAGPPITQSVASNYPGNGPKALAARAVAQWKLFRFRRIAASADWNCFIDQTEYELMGRPKNTSWVVPNLLDTSDIVRDATARSEGDPLDVVFAGRVVRHKGVFDLLDAVARLDREDVQVEIVGTGPDLDALRRAADLLGLEKRVHILGRRSHPELLAILRRSQVLVLPSYAEGLPKVLWEAWASGLAPVMTPVGATERFLTDGRNGRLVAPGDPDALARVLGELADDEGARMSLARAGLETVRRNTWPDAIAVVEDAIERAYVRRGSDHQATPRASHVDA